MEKEEQEKQKKIIEDANNIFWSNSEGE